MIQCSLTHENVEYARIEIIKTRGVPMRIFFSGQCPDGGDYHCWTCVAANDEDCMMDSNGQWEKCANDGQDQAEVIMIFLDAQIIKT